MTSDQRGERDPTQDLNPTFALAVTACGLAHQLDRARPADLERLLNDLRTQHSGGDS